LMETDGWFVPLKLLPEFGRRLRQHWAAAVMGGSIPGIGLFVWSLVGSPPHWAVGLVLLGALLFSAYFTWLEEYLALKSQHSGANEKRLRVRVQGLYGGTDASRMGRDTWDHPTGRIADTVVAVIEAFNSGPPSIAADWRLAIPSDLKLLTNLLEFGMMEGAEDIRSQPIQTGSRKIARLKFEVRWPQGEGTGQDRLPNSLLRQAELTFVNVDGDRCVATIDNQTLMRREPVKLPKP
jgi:hypothetical protein